MMDEISKVYDIGPYVAGVVSFLSAIIGGAVMWGKIKAKTEEQDVKLDTLKKGLYNVDGTLVYITVRQCTEINKQYNKLVYTKFDEIKSGINALTRQMESERNVRHSEMKQIAIFAGRVDEFIQTHKRERTGKL